MRSDGGLQCVRFDPWGDVKTRKQKIVRFGYHTLQEGMPVQGRIGVDPESKKRQYRLGLEFIEYGQRLCHGLRVFSRPSEHQIVGGV